MTSQTPAIVVPRHRRGPGRRLFIGLAAVALAVLVGAGLWQAGRDGDTETATPAAVAVEQPAVARPVESTPTYYYLVGTAAEAAALRELVARLGTPPLPVVVTLATAADADAFFQSIADQNGLRRDHGLAAVTVVDLRAPAATATTVDPLARELEALTAANAVPALGPEALSDQEMYSRWRAEVQGQQQANGMAEARISARGGADAPSATTPDSACESFVDGVAC